MRILAPAMQHALQKEEKGPFWRGDKEGRRVLGLRKTTGDEICWKLCHQLLGTGMNVTRCEVSQN